MRIAVDAMGSDRRPTPDVEGAVLAARQDFDTHQGHPQDTIILVGDQDTVQRELARYDTRGLSIEVAHAPQAVDMHDRPSRTARIKPESSMMIGMGLVRDGKADAFVTAGNTGAALAIATLHTLKRIPGVHRPALTSLVRVENDQLVVLVDLGANADARPAWLVQFGLMGAIYAEHVLGKKQPRVALLSNGEEEGKGNSLVRQTALLLPRSGVNFIGNVEPKEVLQGAADVIVADGFVGNIMLKSLEAVGDTMFRILRRELTSNLLHMLGAFLSRGALRNVYHKVDPFEIGGAPLLGVNGVVIVAHGRTNAKGVKNAIHQARLAVNANVIGALRAGLNGRGADADVDPDLGRPRRRWMRFYFRRPIRFRRRGRRGAARLKFDAPTG
ncbi:MAG: phosphate acyltransferase PlsX [Anaerolineae bacterium]|nr:phosphate acyltransferase PlsX [Anaerolineae bacterium]